MAQDFTLQIWLKAIYLAFSSLLTVFFIERSFYFLNVMTFFFLRKRWAIKRIIGDYLNMFNVTVRNCICRDK